MEEEPPFEPEADDGEAPVLAGEVAEELPLDCADEEDEDPDPVCKLAAAVGAGLLELLLPLPPPAAEPPPPDEAAVLVEPGAAAGDELEGTGAVGPPLPAAGDDDDDEAVPAAGLDPALVQTDAGEDVGEAAEPVDDVLLNVPEPVDDDDVVEAGAEPPPDPDPAEPGLAAIEADVGNGDGGELLSSVEVLLLPLTPPPAADFDAVALEPDAPAVVALVGELDALDRS